MTTNLSQPTQGDESTAEPPKDLPTNEVSLSIPETRYVRYHTLFFHSLTTPTPSLYVSLTVSTTFLLFQLSWSSLTETEKKVAQVYLKYTQDSWDQPGTNELEDNSYDDLDSNGQAGAMSLGLSGEIWDCHINHYSGYYWADLEEGGFDQYYSVLGWNIDNWENDGPVPDTEEAYWDELTPDQQAAASAICYSKDLWNGNAITDWEA